MLSAIVEMLVFPKFYYLCGLVPLLFLYVAALLKFKASGKSIKGFNSIFAAFAIAVIASIAYINFDDYIDEQKAKLKSCPDFGECKPADSLNFWDAHPAQNEY